MTKGRAQLARTGDAASAMQIHSNTATTATSRRRLATEPLGYTRGRRHRQHVPSNGIREVIETSEDVERSRIARHSPLARLREDFTFFGSMSGLTRGLEEPDSDV